MKIALASDHGGYRLKETIKKFLEEENIEYIDFGTNSEESVDYPDFALKAAESIVKEETDRGIFICGTGIGISIAANKVPGIRAALCYNIFAAEMSRRHNNANVLALGGRVIGDELAKAIVKKWLETPFDGGRHERRINKISEIERKFAK
ncbi:ribose 5-phosphate isomerase B [Desulfurobacterium atlanticum]|uniref:Ribose 5-phosphate isomerase B n=1 Tax=Desulfurobacterium atlanticum TaxID=240169 RepID=A0A238ZJM9_9BACT|nr:ribose 5-phosphate isomerase B [Desulfurobacterium atlanticum]SNR83567.1 ribose 5-phosphate isomerase B [Desulfurobacterium atlanticum]